MPRTMPRVAILIETSTSWGRRIIRGFGNYVEAHGPWQLFLEPKGLDEVMALPRGWKGEGIIAAVRTPDLARQLSRLKVPIVNVSGLRQKLATWPRVIVREDEIAKQAFEHMRERGFTRFGYLSTTRVKFIHEKASIFAGIVREAGYECLMYEGSIDTTNSRYFSIEQKAWAKWLARLPKPIALIAWNAIAARRVLEACRSVDVHVPEDVAVLAASSDDLMIEMVQPPISAVELPLERVGFESARLLDEMMCGRKVPDEVLLSPLGVAARQSTDVLAVDEPEIRDVLRFIREHAGDPIGVPDVLRAVPLSRRVLERKFKHILGRTPLEEIRRVRLERAIQLLTKTNLPIPKVATQSGFQYVEHFIPVFRKHIGMTPLAYRKHAHPR